ncbi:Leucine-rich repeat serine/threonine-protein kinase 2 [Phytophthora boehmeriae]|uniref:Leucine-rich repeat serine/threonine-protein kinase 2 n=1 Tax=Phytophthora boehmeriae TaxID=109152 RepID=A0A8T1X1W4_9STRA|nr:Leucine-rich repeat serine/threonine-protein kinase 2 [Phytophthora boehmeriae]
MGASCSVVAAASVPGGGDIVGALAKIWDLCQQYRGSRKTCYALYMRLKVLGNLLTIDSTQLDDDDVADVAIKYHNIVEDFKNCLVRWLDDAEEDSFEWVFKHTTALDKIKAFNEELNKLHEELNYAHIADMKKWQQKDTKWKCLLENKLDQLVEQFREGCDNVTDHVTKEHSTTRDQLNSIRARVHHIADDVRQCLAPSRSSVTGTETSGQLNRGASTAARHVRRKKKSTIPGLLTLVEHGNDDERLAAASMLSKLAEQYHNTIVAKGGVDLLMRQACDGFLKKQMKQIESTLGALYRFPGKKLGVQIVEPMLLVLGEGTTLEAKMMAAGVLDELSNTKDGKEEIARHSGISALVHTIRDCGNQTLMAHSVGVLKNLSGTTSYQPEVAKAIPELITLIQNPEAVLSDLAVVILANLLENYHAEIVAANGIRSLVTLLVGMVDTRIVKRRKPKK